MKHSALPFLVIPLLAVTSCLAASWTGTISDAQCGAKHAASSEAGRNCARLCVKKGAEPVFVTGNKVLKISPGSQEKIKDVVA